LLRAAFWGAANKDEPEKAPVLAKKFKYLFN
jgi:hypothetical protein